jgi:hypothetical protein
VTSLSLHRSIGGDHFPIDARPSANSRARRSAQLAESLTNGGQLWVILARRDGCGELYYFGSSPRVVVLVPKPLGSGCSPTDMPALSLLSPESGWWIIGYCTVSSSIIHRPFKILRENENNASPYLAAAFPPALRSGMSDTYEMSGAIISNDAPAYASPQPDILSLLCEP